MKKLIVAVMVAVCAGTALAMPTKAELTKAQPLVEELMSPETAKFKAAGYKEKAEAAVKVGDAAAEFAKAAETEAAKFLLLKGAISFYVRGEQYDKAADTVAELQRTVKDIPPAAVAEITGKATSRISEKKAPRLYATYRTAKLQVRASNDAKALAAKLKKVKSDALQRKYAEALAVSGDWKAAYAEFAKVGDEATKSFTAKEAGGDATDTESGEFWWTYKPAMEDADDFFKARAAAFYRRAIDAGEIEGLKKNIVEQRIEKVKALSGAIGEAPVADDGLYCVIDLSGGPDATRYPVKYRNAIPKGGWTDKYKTTKLVLRRMEPGSFEYMPGKTMTLTKPFYIGIFEVTQKQYALVCGNNPSRFKGDRRPVDWIAYETVRGKEKGMTWPMSAEVDDNTFIGKLRRRTALHADLPTEVQWEYACRAGTKTKFNCDTDDGQEVLKYCRCTANGGVQGHTTDVGSYLPNKWGLYDMHGNAFEWCLDRSDQPDGLWSFNWTEQPKDQEMDNVGSQRNTDMRILRGGMLDRESMGEWLAQTARHPRIRAGVGLEKAG